MFHPKIRNTSKGDFRSSRKTRKVCGSFNAVHVQRAMLWGNRIFSDVSEPESTNLSKSAKAEEKNTEAHGLRYGACAQR